MPKLPESLNLSPAPARGRAGVGAGVSIQWARFAVNRPRISLPVVNLLLFVLPAGLSGGAS